nr:MAG TPA: hypothetical protein [Caudoviricetes sp.]
METSRAFAISFSLSKLGLPTMLWFKAEAETPISFASSAWLIPLCLHISLTLNICLNIKIMLQI